MTRVDSTAISARAGSMEQVPPPPYLPAGGQTRAPRRSGPAAEMYETSVVAAAGQLAIGSGGRRSPAMLAVLPAVGFANQSAATLAHAIGALAAHRSLPAPLDVLVVVNRPAGRPADGTLDLLCAALSGQRRADAPRFHVCELELAQRPRIGELRQLAVDAAARVWGALDDGLPVLLMDDDVVSLPPTALDRLRGALEAGADLALGPVLFDDPRIPMCLLVELYLTDLFRALVAARLAEALAQASRPAPPDPATFESLVLTGNLAVRHAALRSVGGFRDLNEVTWLLRDLVETGAVVHAVPAGTGADPVLGLLDGAVRMSSRRALAAWRGGRHPTVAQWRGCRLRSSRPDPVRLARPLESVPPPVSRWRRSERETMLEGLGPALAVTLDHLEPPPEVARWALGQLGAEASDWALRPPSAARRGWRVVLHRDAGVLARVDELQRRELSRHAAELVGAPPAPERLGEATR